MRKKISDMTLEELWELFPIFLVEHKNSWKDYYLEMEERIRSELAEIQIVRVSHIGSTAINNIRAKDIVDILLEVAHTERLENAAKRIEEMGFVKMSFSEGRYSFNIGYTEEGFADKVYHLHLRYDGDNDELYFRDYMNEHPQYAKEYECLKMDLQKKYEHDRDGYTNAKTEFVKKYTAEAKKKYTDRFIGK
ncbi:MAG: GrpB family protein [Clostridia bacterium]|nr:GrpB family protein [Clostridia bacterium]